MDTTYELFVEIYEVITNKKSQLDVDPDIFKLLDELGLVDDKLNKIKIYHDKILNNKLLMIKNFIDGKNKFLMPDSYTQYLEYLPIFSSDDKIIPVQIMIINGYIRLINIHDGVPIFIDNYKGKTLEDHNIILNNEPCNVYDIREKMLFSSFKDDSCDDIIHHNFIYNKDVLTYLNEFLFVYENINDVKKPLFPITKFMCEKPIDNTLCNNVNKIIFDNSMFIINYQKNNVSHKSSIHLMPDDYGRYEFDKYEYTIYCCFVNVSNIIL